MDTSLGTPAQWFVNAAPCVWACRRGVLHKLLLDWDFPTDPQCLKRYPVSDSSLGKNVLLMSEGIKQRSEYFKLPLAATEVCRRASWNATRSILADSFALVRSPFSSGPLGSIGSHFLIHQVVPEEFWRLPCPTEGGSSQQAVPLPWWYTWSSIIFWKVVPGGDDNWCISSAI